MFTTVNIYTMLMSATLKMQEPKEVLQHYLEKCKKVIFQQYSTVISIHHQVDFQTFPKYSSFSNGKLYYCTR